MSLLSETSTTAVNASVTDSQLVTAATAITNELVLPQLVLDELTVESATVAQQINAGAMTLPSEIAGTVATLLPSQPALLVEAGQTGTAIGVQLTAVSVDGNALNLEGQSSSAVPIDIQASTSTGTHAIQFSATNSGAGRAIEWTGDTSTGDAGGQLRVTGNATDAEGVLINGEGGGLGTSIVCTSQSGVAFEADADTGSGGLHGIDVVGTTASSSASASGVMFQDTLSVVANSNTGIGLRVDGTSTSGIGTHLTATDEILISGNTTDGEGLATTGTSSDNSGTTSALRITSTLTSATTPYPPILIDGTTTGTSPFLSVGQSMGWTFPSVLPGDADYTVPPENQMGLVVFYNTTLTAERTVTLPTTAAAEYTGLNHVIIIRRTGGAFDLVVDAGAGVTIHGISVSAGSGIVNIPGVQTLATLGVTNASVHLARNPGSLTQWNIIGVADNFA